MKVLEAIIEKWCNPCIDTGETKGVMRQQVERRCADELEALLPALEAEIAALKETMACTHPRACWQAVKPDSVDAVVGYRCVACEHERLAVAAAEEAQSLRIFDAIEKAPCGMGDLARWLRKNAKHPHGALAAVLIENAECLPDCNPIMHADLCPYVNTEAAIRALKREKRGGE